MLRALCVSVHVFTALRPGKAGCESLCLPPSLEGLLDEDVRAKCHPGVLRSGWTLPEGSYSIFLWST